MIPCSQLRMDLNVAFAQMFVGSFEPADYVQFQTDTVSAFDNFAKAGVDRLIIDLTDNGGMVPVLVRLMIFMT